MIKAAFGAVRSEWPSTLFIIRHPGVYSEDQNMLFNIWPSLQTSEQLLLGLSQIFYNYYYYNYHWVYHNYFIIIIAKQSPSQSKSIPIGLDVDGITFAISPPPTPRESTDSW